MFMQITVQRRDFRHRARVKCTSSHRSVALFTRPGQGQIHAVGAPVHRTPRVDFGFRRVFANRWLSRSSDVKNSLAASLASTPATSSRPMGCRRPPEAHALILVTTSQSPGSFHRRHETPDSPASGSDRPAPRRTNPRGANGLRQQSAKPGGVRPSRQRAFPFGHPNQPLESSPSCKVPKRSSGESSPSPRPLYPHAVTPALPCADLIAQSRVTPFQPQEDLP